MATQGTEKHYRIIVLLSKCGTKTTRRLLCKHIEDSSPSGQQTFPWTLDKFLSHNQQSINFFPNGKPRYILDKHKRFMFPTEGRLPATQPADIEEWDLLLLCNLLIDACDLSSTTKLDLKKMKKIRNKVCHTNDASLSDEKYDDYAKTIEVILDRFLVLINDNDLTDEIQKQIKDVKDGALTCLESSIQTLDEWHKSQKDMSNQIERLQENVEAQYKDVKEIKELLLKHFTKSVPETKLVMVVKNCNSEQEEYICRKLIGLVYPILQSLEDETKDAITLAMKGAMKQLLSEDIQLQTVNQECISFYLKCPSVQSLLDLWMKCTNGELTKAFQPVEECIRSLVGFENIRLQVNLPEKEFIRCLNLIVTEIVRKTGSPYVHATLDDRKDEHNDHSDNQGTSIEQDIELTSISQLKRILQKVESGCFTDDIQSVAVACEDSLGIDDALIDAHLVSETRFQGSVVASISRLEIEDIDETSLPLKAKHGLCGETDSQNTIYDQFDEGARIETKRIFNEQRNVPSENSDFEKIVETQLLIKDNDDLGGKTMSEITLHQQFDDGAQMKENRTLSKPRNVPGDNSVRMSSSFKLSSDESAASVMSSSFTLSSDEAKDSMRSSLLQSSEEVQEVFCDPCTIGEGLEKAALFYCKECKEFLCGDCREFHKKVSITRNHHVSRIDEPEIASGQSGKIKELSKQLSNITVSNTTGQTPAIQTTDSVKSFTTATLTNRINVSLDDDKEPCEITSIIVVDNLIYVGDKNNDKIKLFDMKGQPISQYSEYGPFNLASAGKYKIVCATLKNKLMIISRKRNTLKHVKTINPDAPMWGVCCYNDLIYVSCYSQMDPPSCSPQIQVFTLDLKLKRRIEPLLDGSFVLHKPGFLTINQRTGILYVSDFTKGVIAISPAGKVQFVKQVFNETKTAQGISLDDQGQVYICGMNTHNVMTISADGRDVSEILRKESGSAQDVEIVGNQMYFCCRCTDIVRVFTLS